MQVVICASDQLAINQDSSNPLHGIEQMLEQTTELRKTLNLPVYYTKKDNIYR